MGFCYRYVGKKKSEQFPAASVFSLHHHGDVPPVTEEEQSYSEETYVL